MKKSETCFSKNGNPLSEFETEEEALRCAEHEKYARGTNFYPYHCKTCGKYHLAPEERRINVLHDACFCTDSNGKPKALYVTHEDAEKVAEQRKNESSRKLYIYECPTRKGFHLTHKSISEWY